MIVHSVYFHSEIDFHNFIEKRAHEMEAMMQSSRAVKENQRIMQKLPRHMRRRAASHDVRRLPLALREAASREVDGCFVVTRFK